MQVSVRLANQVELKNEINKKKKKKKNLKIDSFNLDLNRLKI